MSTVDEVNPTTEPLPELNRRSGGARWLMVGAVAGLMLLVLVFPFPVDGRLWNHLFDLAHAPAFCFLLLAVTGFVDPGSIGLSRRLSVLREVRSGELMVLAGGCLLLGCVGEMLQAFAGRSPGVGDLLANTAGVISGVCWISSRRVSGRRRWLLSAIALIILLAAVVRPIAGIRGALLQRADFPLLASFERSIDLGAWAESHSSMQRTTEWASDGSWSLRVDLFPGRYSGVNMTWPLRDWRGYDQLRWDLQNPGNTPLRLVVKIFDRPHRLAGFDPSDRFESIVEIPPGGRHELVIDLDEVAQAPESRPMDLRKVNGVELFAIDLASHRTLFLDNMRLVNSAGPAAQP